MPLIHFQSRVSKGIRLFFLFIALTDISFGMEPRTAEGRTNRSAFPLIRFQDRYEPIPAGAESSLRAKLEEVLAPIQLLPRSWFSATFQIAATQGERTRLLDVDGFSEIEIWKCVGEYCQGCPGSEQLGCILGAKTPTGFGVVALIHPCLYGTGKCTKKGDIDGWAERFITNSVYFKLGLSENALPRKTYQDRSSKWIRKTSAAVNEALGSCPGPYSEKTLMFLRENQAVAQPNSALKKCGEKYLSALKRLQDQCPILKSEMKDSWASYLNAQFTETPRVLRGDHFSRKMLCRRNDATTLFTVVGTNPTLILFDGACEGESPNSLGSFLKAALPPSLKARLMSLKCLPQGEQTTREVPNISELGNGPEIQLVE